MTMPSVFISHGGPDIVLGDSPARKYLEGLSTVTGTPEAIVICSAHFETGGAVVVSDPNPEMIYDFGGFPDELYRMVYSAPGSPELAGRIQSMLTDAGIETQLLARRGFDHGVWTPMKLAFPKADIPVVQLSIDPGRDAAYHFALGAALAPLRAENILLVGSGHITHNLRAVFGVMRTGILNDTTLPGKVDAFTEWFNEKLGQGDRVAVLDWKKQAPFAADNHPTDEHLMPLFFAFGAGGPSAHGRRAHHSTQFGFFTYDSWLFD